MELNGLNGIERVTWGGGLNEGEGEQPGTAGIGELGRRLSG